MTPAPALPHERLALVLRPTPNRYVVADRELAWHPPKANAPFIIDVVKYFHNALGENPVAYQ